MFSQGYIGVSNNPEKRWEYHKKRGENAHIRNAVKKYGWDNLVKKVVLIGDESYCLEIENKLRSLNKIGWNLVSGGGRPPSSLGRKFGPMSDATKAKVSAAKIGMPSWNKGLKLNNAQKQKLFNLSEYMKDKPHGRLGKTLSQSSIESIMQKKIGKKQSTETIEKRRKKLIGRKLEKVTCPNCQSTFSVSLAKRYHFNNCKGLRPYKARVTIDGKRIFLGSFETQELATNAEIKAYKDANKPLSRNFKKIKGIQ